MNVKRRLVSYFTAATLGLIGLQSAQADIVPPSLACGFILATKGQNPARSMISARDALHYAQTHTRPKNAGRDINRLIDIVARAQEIPLGRAMTKKVADGGVILGVGSLGDEVYGAYMPAFNVLILSWKASDFDFRSDADFHKNRDICQNTFYHELTHFYQRHVWHMEQPPQGWRSFDRGLWGLANEAQAKLVARLAMHQHKDIHFKPDPVILAASFADQMLMLNPDYFKSYGLNHAHFADGQAMDVAVFNKAFGLCPWPGVSLLDGTLTTPDDVYKEYVLPNSALKPLYERQGGARVSPKPPIARPAA